MTSSCLGKQEPGCANRHGKKAFIRNMWRQKKFIFEGKMEGFNKSTKKPLYQGDWRIRAIWNKRRGIFRYFSNIKRSRIRHSPWYEPFFPAFLTPNHLPPIKMTYFLQKDAILSLKIYHIFFKMTPLYHGDWHIRAPFF